MGYQQRGIKNDEMERKGESKQARATSNERHISTSELIRKDKRKREQRSKEEGETISTTDRSLQNRELQPQVLSLPNSLTAHLLHILHNKVRTAVLDL